MMNQKALEAVSELLLDLLPISEYPGGLEQARRVARQRARHVIETYYTALPDEDGLIGELHAWSSTPGLGVAPMLRTLLKRSASALEAERAKSPLVVATACPNCGSPVQAIATRYHNAYATPEGWRLVPEELTDEIGDAICAAIRQLEGDNYFYQLVDEAVWKAVLAAYDKKGNDD